MHITDPVADMLTRVRNANNPLEPGKIPGDRLLCKKLRNNLSG